MVDLFVCCRAINNWTQHHWNRVSTDTSKQHTVNRTQHIQQRRQNEEKNESEFEQLDLHVKTTSIFINSRSGPLDFTNWLLISQNHPPIGISKLDINEIYRYVYTRTMIWNLGSKGWVYATSAKSMILRVTMLFHVQLNPWRKDPSKLGADPEPNNLEHPTDFKQASH